MMSAVTFELLSPNDYPLICEWRNSPQVRQWYYDYDNPHRVYTTEYIRAYHERKATENPRLGQYTIVLDGVKAGFVQCYSVSDYPDYNSHIQVDDTTAAVDIFLAPSFMHKGYGSRIMRTFLDEIVFSSVHFFADKCLIGPEPTNTAAIKMYRKAGFSYRKTVQISGEQEPEYIMLLHRDELT